MASDNETQDDYNRAMRLGTMRREIRLEVNLTVNDTATDPDWIADVVKRLLYRAVQMQIETTDIVVKSVKVVSRRTEE